MEKKIIQVQLALFFQTDYMDSFEKFSLKLKDKLGKSKFTQLIPIPSNAPSEIPRLILNYEKFSVNVSKNRLDLFCKDIKSINLFIPNVCDVFFDELSLRIGRIGFVKRFFIDKDIENLKKLLPKDKIRNLNLKEITIRINERKLIEGYNCNNIESAFSGFIVKKGTDGAELKQKGIIEIRDINTLAEEIKKNDFDKSKVIRLFKAFEQESNNFILLK